MFEESTSSPYGARVKALCRTLAERHDMHDPAVVSALLWACCTSMHAHQLERAEALRVLDECWRRNFGD